MPDARETAREQYQKARAEFEKLDTQDRTAFVVEATFATVGRAVEDAGRQLSDLMEEVNQAFSRTWADRPPREPKPPKPPSPAKPPTATKRASSATRKTGTARKEGDDAG